MSITFDTRQLDALKEKGKAARALLQQDGVVMRQIAVFLDRWVQKNFQSSGGQVGGWAAYKYGGRLTTKKKANGQSIDGHRYINGTAKLMMNTGSLRISFLPFTSLGNAGIGSGLPYSKPHEEGTTTLPQRRLLPVETEVVGDVRQIMDDWIKVTIGRML
jgi:phage gpG-like protein